MSVSTLDRVRHVIAAEAHLGDAAEVDPNVSLRDGGLHLDSIAMLELLLATEKEFCVELDAQELLEAGALRTVRAFAEFVEAKLKGGGTCSAGS